ncbi:MAG: TIM barrel protein [Pseudomonadota bacterium]
MTPGLGSFAFRWSMGFRDRVPPAPLCAMDLVEIAAQEGFQVVQIADNHPLHLLDAEQLTQLRKAANANQITLELGASACDRETVQRYLAIAARIEAPILRVAVDKADAQKDLDGLATEFASLLPRARDVGCRIAIENHFDFPSQRIAALVDLVADDHLGVCLDVANSICAGEWPMETVQILAEKTINLHLKDYVIAPDPYGVGFRIHGAPLGTGRSDCAAILDALQRRPMSVIYEHWLPWPGNFNDARSEEEAWTRQAAKTLGGLLAPVGGGGQADAAA